ncbi:hypothetical protein EDD68_10359 [Melghiribacillus thermohalophilus]|uniref:WYL domain-containing protein n=1 Tax=Melghiribacillus thermohalophilus TaxID=1324956 RepID=A0A4R3NE66_9BACI|nr:transcriptional regulator [Melghiribacillus thermohalophilus]TCT25506.1 hypothetical protein EDD68_10359 [Melghiribacillus thermohalophilus]
MHVYAKKWQYELADIMYMSKNGEITKRRIKIYGENRERIFAYCYLRKGFRSFNKDQILASIPVRKR